MPITWNVVNRTGQAFDAIAAKVQARVARIERLLVRYPEGSVHLQVIASQNANKRSYGVAINLRIPSDVLHADKTAAGIGTALDRAFQAIVREIERKKGRYHPHRPLPTAKAAPVPSIETVEAAAAANAQPQSPGELVLDLLRSNYEPLLQFAERRLAEPVLDGSLPEGAVDARDVVDHVAQVALRHPGMKPADLSYLQWFRALAFHEINRIVAHHAGEQNALSLDSDVAPRGALALAEEHGPFETFLDALEEQLEPAEATAADFIPAPAADTEEAAQEPAPEDILPALRKVTRRWSRTNRLVFDLFFIEGIGADEIAVMINLPLPQVQRRIASAQKRLRRSLAHTAAAPGATVSPAEHDAFAARASTHLKP